MLYNLFENRDFVSVFAVALLAEGVDRNPSSVAVMPCTMVALLAEGVDRNNIERERITKALRSPSSRRAWIEIRSWLLPCGSPQVALLAEGVDRNTCADVL